MDEHTKIAMTTVYAAIFFVALAGNSLMIHIIRKLPGKPSRTNLLLINMAVADLLIALSVLPFAVYLYYTSGSWFSGPVAEVLCKFTWLGSHVALAGSITTLVAMAVERFLAIVYLRKAPLRKVRWVSLAIWLFSLLVMSPVGAVATVNKANNTSRCRRNWSVLGDPQPAEQIFYTFSFFAMYAVPCILMAVLYAMIGRKLWRRQVPGDANCEQNRKIVQNSRRRVIRLLVAIVSVFALCWLPIQVMNMIAAFKIELLRQIPSNINFVLYLLGYSNCAINPCLCLALNSKFRLAFVNMFTHPRAATERRATQTTQRLIHL